MFLAFMRKIVLMSYLLYFALPKPCPKAGNEADHLCFELPKPRPKPLTVKPKPVCTGLPLACTYIRVCMHGFVNRTGKTFSQIENNGTSHIHNPVKSLSIPP